MIALTIPGEAVPFARSGGNGKHRFTPKRQRHFGAVTRDLAAQAMAGLPPMEGPLFLQARFEYLIPASWSKKKQTGTRYKTSKPDTDNLVKLIKDGLNKIVWVDDAQVARLEAEKVYGLTARTIITVTSLQEVA